MLLLILTLSTNGPFLSILPLLLGDVSWDCWLIRGMSLLPHYLFVGWYTGIGNFASIYPFDTDSAHLTRILYLAQVGYL